MSGLAKWMNNFLEPLGNVPTKPTKPPDDRRKCPSDVLANPGSANMHNEGMPKKFHTKGDTMPKRDKVIPLIRELKEHKNEAIKELQKIKEPEKRYISAFEKVRAIEPYAISLGWKRDQLFNTYENYAELGLVCYIKDFRNIGEVTKEFIELYWTDVHGQKKVHRFCNHNIDLPWRKHVRCKPK